MLKVLWLVSAWVASLQSIRSSILLFQAESYMTIHMCIYRLSQGSEPQFAFECLIAGLEQWNGLWNGLWNFMYSWRYCVLASFSFPFPLRQTSEDSPLLQQRLLAVYKMCWLKLINYVCDLWPIQLWGGYMNEGHCKAELAMNRLVSKYLDSRARYCLQPNLSSHIGQCLPQPVTTHWAIAL